VGFRYGRNLSRTRRLSVTFGGGTVHVDTKNNLTFAPLTYWTPTAYASARFDFARSWALMSDYRRGVSVLQGLRPLPFAIDAASASIGGFLWSRFEATIIGAYSNGQAGQIDPVPGRFNSYTGTGQLRFAVTRRSSVVVSYTRYKYELNAVASGNLGLVPRMDRNAIRVGFAVSLPIVQAYRDQPDQNAGGY
jgi:hypothetical protein